MLQDQITSDDSTSENSDVDPLAEYFSEIELQKMSKYERSRATNLLENYIYLSKQGNSLVIPDYELFLVHINSKDVQTTLGTCVGSRFPASHAAPKSYPVVATERCPAVCYNSG